MCLSYCISYVHMNIQSQQIHKFHLSKTVKNFGLLIFAIHV